MEMAEQRVVQLLAQAHANELALVQTLTEHSRIAEHRPYRQLLEEHLRETQEHAQDIQRRLDELGWRRSLVATTYGIAQNVIRQGLALAKGPADLVRGGMDTKQKMLRNAMDEVMTEGMEISCYDAIESVARGLGDHKTADLAATIRLDEERMFDALRKEIPVLAEQVVASTTTAGTRPLEAPWPGYDDMTVDQIGERLNDASPALILAVRNYERKNKNRTTVIDATSRET